MLNYLKFLLFVNLKKKGLYISFLALVGFFCLLFVATINSANDEKSQGLFPIDKFVIWFPFVFSTLFVTLLVIRTFKTGENDGTELLISAKPISRKSMILAKFINIYILMLIFHIFLFGFYIAISQIDTYANASDKIKFATSMVIGGIIMSTIIMSIVILISTVLGSVGTITIGIIVSAAFPIISFSIIPISNAISPSDDSSGLLSDKNRQYLLPELASDGEATYDINKQERISFADSFDKDKLKENKNTWYRYAKYFDLWYHWGRFYSLLPHPKKNAKNYSSYKVKLASYEEVDNHKLTNIVDQAKKTAIKVKYNSETPKTWIAMFSKDELEFDRNHLSKILDRTKYNNLTKKNGTLPSLIKNINKKVIDYLNSDGDATPADDTIETGVIEIILRNLKTAFLKPEAKIGNEDPNNKKVRKYYRLMLWRAINDYGKNNPENIIDLVYLSRLLFAYVVDEYLYGPAQIRLDEDDPNFYEKVSKRYYIVKNYKENDYIDTKSIVIVYIIVGIFFVMISIIVSLRKDFR